VALVPAAGGGSWAVWGFGDPRFGLNDTQKRLDGALTAKKAKNIAENQLHKVRRVVRSLHGGYHRNVASFPSIDISWISGACGA
jgi:hypothetical protein